MHEKQPNFNSRQLKQIAKDFHKELTKGRIPKYIRLSYLYKELKYDLTESETDKILNVLDEDTFDKIISNPLPSDYKSLSPLKDLYVSERKLIKDLSWILKFIVDYAQEINIFLKLEERFQNNLILGNYQEAKNILDEIDSEVCYSAWSIQQKLIVAELEKGFKANKDVLSLIISNENATVINFIAHYTSIRIEKNISLDKYNTLINDYLKHLQPDLHNYVLFKVDFFKNVNFKDFQSILMFESTLSIIDRYKTFIQISQLLLSQKKQIDDIIFFLGKHLKNLVSIIDDTDIKLLVACIFDYDFKDFKANDGDLLFEQIVESYTNENYNLVIELFKKYAHINAICFPSIIMYCKALSYLNKPFEPISVKISLINNIASKVLSILRRDINFTSETYFDLIRIAHVLGNHPLSIGIYFFLKEQFPNKIKIFSDINIFKFYILTSKSLNPIAFEFQAQSKQKLFLQKLNFSLFPFTTSLFQQVLNMNDDVQSLEKLTLRELKFFAKIVKGNGGYIQALAILHFIFTQEKFFKALEITHLKYELLAEKFNCLVILGRLESALELCATSVINEPKVSSFFYDPSFLETLTKVTDTSLQSNICLPIILKFFETEIDFYYVYVAFDNFLCSQGCETPSEFIRNVYNNKSQTEIYFLDKVCHHEVLHSSPHFKDQEELDLARIEICNTLIKSSTNPKNFELEVSELLRKILVRKGIKQIDYSKIYVDVKGLKNTVNIDLRDSFIRNIEIASLPVDQINKIIESVGNILVYYKENNADTLSPSFEEDELANLKLTSYNRFLHFEEAFLNIRDRFISSTDHGLDTYLSMRIRHGTLLAQIRSIFESHELITVWSDLEKNYLSNKVWLDKLNITDEQKQRLSNQFDHFSSAVDLIAEQLKTKTIQIKTETKDSSGLFDFTYTEKNLLRLFSEKFGSIKDFDVFVDEIINILWVKTEECLLNIRKYLNGEFINKFEEAFAFLENEISSIELENASTNDIQELKQRIRNCKTAIRVEIKKISEWFKKSNKKIIDEFDFSILFDSCITTFQRIYPDLKNENITIENTCEFKIDGEYFPYLTDMIFYLLDNAIKHSRIALANLELKIKVEIQKDLIVLTFANTVLSEDEYINSLREKLVITNSLIRKEEIYRDINKEGGTGYAKIKKTISQDLNRKIYALRPEIKTFDTIPWFETTIAFEYNGLQTLK